MRTITVVNNLTLDGVMQAPGRPDEDTRDAFAHGGWAQPYSDATLAEAIGPRLGGGGGGAFLFGRRTHELLERSWSGRTDNPFSPILDRSPKYVASHTLRTPSWEHTTVIGQAPASVAALKATDGPDLTVLGSGELLRSLIPAGLIDTYLLMIHPLLLGSGRPLFGPHGTPIPLSLTDTIATSTGVIVSTYRPA